MSIKRQDLIDYLKSNGFYMLREGRKHSIYTKGVKTLPVKRHRTLDRVTAIQYVSRLALNLSFNNLLHWGEVVLTAESRIIISERKVTKGSVL